MFSIERIKTTLSERAGTSSFPIKSVLKWVYSYAEHLPAHHYYVSTNNETVHLEQFLLSLLQSNFNTILSGGTDKDLITYHTPHTDIQDYREGKTNVLNLWLTEAPDLELAVVRWGLASIASGGRDFNVQISDDYRHYLATEIDNVFKGTAARLGRTSY